MIGINRVLCFLAFSLLLASVSHSTETAVLSDNAKAVLAKWEVVASTMRARITSFKGIPGKASLASAAEERLRLADLSVRNYVKVKDAQPPAKQEEIMAAVDDVYNQMVNLRLAVGNLAAKGSANPSPKERNMVTLLGNALRDAMQTIQQALGNMR